MHDVADELVRPQAPPGWQARLAAVAPSLAGRSVAQLLAVAVGVLLALAAGVAAVVWLVRSPPPPVELGLPRATTTVPTGAAPGGPGPAPPAGAPTTAATHVVVQAAGAVARPGVYRLPDGARVADLLAVAGGPAPDADADRLALAARLADGQRVYVPRVGEDVVPEVGAPGVAAAPGTGGIAGGPAGPATPVDLNTATAAELDTLPGVGPATAAAIVEHRTRHGPFPTVEALLDVPGIGPAKLEALRGLVRV